MGADIVVGHSKEGCQPPPYHRVRVEFNPYDHDQVQDLLVKIRREFPKGEDKNRWKYSVPQDTKPNVWPLDFLFRDIEDAMIFGLKYSK
jgi:hypothetical protein